MGRKKKRRRSGSGGEADPQPRSVPDRISRPFAEALKGVKPAEPKAAVPARKPGHAATKQDAAKKDERAPVEAAPADGADYTYEERVAFRDAMDGVRPLGEGPTRPVQAPPRVPTASEARAASSDADDAERRARERLAALVAGGVRFEIEREDDVVRGKRAGLADHVVRDLRGGRATADATLDLHGLRGDEAERTVVRFVRQQRRASARLVRIVHGKGQHSEGGVGVLADRVVTALTGGAAPFVAAFVTAAHDTGGTGALLVRLMDH